MAQPNFKLDAMRTIMKTPSLAKMVLGAIKSPAGSTARTKAMNIINSFYQANSNRLMSQTIPLQFNASNVLPQNQNQGQGGGAAPVQTPSSPPVTIRLKPILAENILRNRQQLQQRMQLETLAQQNEQVSPTQNQRQTSGDGQGGALPLNTSYNNGSLALPSSGSNLGGPILDINNLSGNQSTGLETNINNYQNLQSLPSVQLANVTAPNSSLSSLLGQDSSPYGKLSLIYGNNQLLGQPQFGGNLIGGNIQDLLGLDNTQQPQTSAILNFNQTIPRTGTPTSTAQPSSIQQQPSLENALFVKHPSSPQVYFVPTGDAIDLQTYKRLSSVGDFSDIATIDSTQRLGAILQQGKQRPTLGPEIPDSIAGTQQGISGQTGSGISTPITADTGDPLIDFLIQSYKQGIGRSAFALGVMADAQKLQQLFPGVPVDKIPVGASLAGQLNDLQNRLIEENKINELRDNLLRKQAVGQTLQEDLTAYIRGKDEYLNTLDGMLNNTVEQFWSSSNRSDPFYQQSMGNYIDYLTILKGRQTQRYIDFLNTGINYHNAQISNLQNQYNSAVEQVNQVFQQQAAITTEQYQQTKSVLEDMYDNVVKRLELQDVNSQAYWELQKTQADAIKSIAEAEKAQQGISGNGTLEPVNSKADLDLIDQIVGEKSSIVQAINDPVTAQYGVDKVLSRFLATQKTKVTEQIQNNGEIDSVLDNIKQSIQEYLSLSEDDYRSIGEDDPNASATNYAQTMLTAVETAIRNFVQAHYNEILDILDSMKSKKNRNDFSHWQDKNSQSELLTDDINKRLLQIVDAFEQVNDTRDYTGKSAQEISDALIGIIAREIGINV